MSKDLTDALRKLTEKPKSAPNVVPRPRGAAPRVVAVGTPPAAPAGGEGGGIASPLTETARTHYAERAVASTDGLFSVRITPIRSLTMLDADENIVVLNFLDPT